MPGYADALGVDLGNQMIDSGQDPAEIKNKVLAWLKANPDAGRDPHPRPHLGASDAGRARRRRLDGEIHFGTFDLSGRSRMDQDDVIAFAIDQQPYLQGYLPVVILANLARFGVVPSGHINSGPGFVTKANIGQVEEYAGEDR